MDARAVGKRARLAASRLRVTAWPIEELARRAGLLPYRTERWSVEEWQSAYRSGQLDYFASLPELPRYAVLAGYLTRFGADRSLLDVGCGQGILRRMLDGIPFRTYVGVDVSDSALESANALADSRTTFVHGDVMDVELPPADVVVLNEVLYYAEDPAAMLGRIDGLLPDGGVVLTSMWRHGGDRTLWKLLDRRYGLVDATDVRSLLNTVAKRGWRVSCHLVRKGS